MERIARMFLGLVLLAAMPAAFALTAPNVSWQFNNSLNEDNGGTPITLANTAAIGSKSSYVTDTIDGQSATVMEFNGYASGDAVQVLTGLAANGSTTATRVNQYTVVMDLKVMAGAWPPLFETAHSDGDAEIFYQGSNSTIGRSSGYYFKQTSTTLQNNWFRLAITVDMINKVSKLYANGQFLGQFDSSHSNVSGGQDGRMALTPGPAASFWLFGEDNYDGDQDGEQGRINTLAVYDHVLTADEVDQLGGPSADGISSAAVPPTRAITLAIAKTQSQNAGAFWDAWTDPLNTGDVTNRWSVNGAFPGGNGYINNLNGDGFLRINHANAGNWDHPWIEVQTAPTVALASDMEAVFDLRPVFDPARNYECVTMLVCDAAASASNHDGNYDNADFALRLTHQLDTLAIQCTGTGTSAALSAATPQAISGITASTLKNIRFYISYHDGAYYAYYMANNDVLPTQVTATPITKARAKTTLRLTAESLFSASGYSSWDTYVDQIRVYTGFESLPVELSTFAAE